MPSLRSRLLVAFLRVTRRKRIYSSIEALHEGIYKVRLQGPARPTPEMMGSVIVEREALKDIEVYRLSPHVKPSMVIPVLYLHGGAYVRPITSFHWRFLRSLVEQTGCTFIVPLYPLAPEANCASAVETVRNVYLSECARAGVESLAVMGDSAGGGLALGLCYALRQKAFPLPRSLTLICPWVDVTMTNTSIALLKKATPCWRQSGQKKLVGCMPVILASGIVTSVRYTESPATFRQSCYSRALTTYPIMMRCCLRRRPEQRDLRLISK